MTKYLALPDFSTRYFYVWRRNSLVWRKLAVPALLGNLADPMIYMFGLGYGLGAMLSDMNGMSYIAFLAAGTVCSSTMMSASFEAMYSGFSRMHVQRTWDAIMNAPVTLDDVVLLTGLAFASLGLIITALSPSYDFFSYYFTLALTPMMLVCGVFFPVTQLPAGLQVAAQILPLTHAIELVRPLLNGVVPAQALMHFSVLAVYAVAGFYVALVLMRRRLLK